MERSQCEWNEFGSDGHGGDTWTRGCEHGYPHAASHPASLCMPLSNECVVPTARMFHVVCCVFCVCYGRVSSIVHPLIRATLESPTIHATYITSITSITYIHTSVHKHHPHIRPSTCIDRYPYAHAIVHPQHVRAPRLSDVHSKSCAETSETSVSRRETRRMRGVICVRLKEHVNTLSLAILSNICVDST